MTRQEIESAIQHCEERLLALQAVMCESDAHAAKCAKLGLDFKSTYPADYEAYLAANKEYNEVEAKLADLKMQRDEMEERGEEEI